MGHVRNCVLIGRPGDVALFREHKDGLVDASLDGYAVVPIEEWHALNGATGYAPEDHWPCGKCGASGPTEAGHDPCIANLPGVVHACCGHGYGHAYAMFKDGTIIRGHFTSPVGGEVE